MQEMDIWSRIFVEKLHIIFQVCIRKDRGRGSKITTNMWISFYGWPQKQDVFTTRYEDIQNYLENPTSEEPTLEKEILHRKP